MDKSKNYNILYLVVLVLALIIMVIGISFAVYSLSGKEKDDSTQIRTGTLSVNYTDGKTINVHDLFPITEPKLEDTLYVYKKNFTITNNGTLDETINIYIKITKNEFVSNHLMYSLYDSKGNKITSSSFSNEGNKLITSDVFLKSNESKSYTMLIWLNETFENQNNEQKCNFTGQFDIWAEQIKYK